MEEELSCRRKRSGGRKKRENKRKRSGGKDHILNKLVSKPNKILINYVEEWQTQIAAPAQLPASWPWRKPYPKRLCGHRRYN